MLHTWGIAASVICQRRGHIVSKQFPVFYVDGCDNEAMAIGKARQILDPFQQYGDELLIFADRTFTNVE